MGEYNPNYGLEAMLAAGITPTTENISYTTGTLPGAKAKANDLLRVGMQLWGLPHQFLDTTDQRSSVSPTIGRKFVENIILDSSIVTIIPGKPKYLPGVRDKGAVTNMLLEAITNGNFDNLHAIKNGIDEEIRLYDFQSAYIEFFGYANMLCRIAAGYLDLSSHIEKTNKYIISGHQCDFMYFDWKHYKWNGRAYQNFFGRNLTNLRAYIGDREGVDFKDNSIGFGGVIDSKDLSEREQSVAHDNYMQFYVDAGASTGSQSLSNNTQPSMFKTALDQGSQGMRDLAFLAGAGGLDTSGLTSLGESAMNAINTIITGGDGVPDSGPGAVLSRLLSTGKNVMKGENIMMPDIWAGSSNSKSYTLNLNFKAAYGNRITNYVEVIVPTLVCMALAYPRGTSANSYGSPPLVKVYKRGEFTCGMGMVTSIEISNENEDGFSIDNTPMEVRVSLGITDLYSDMALTPPGDPLLFVSNSSLVDFLATTCGLDLMQPQLEKKVRSMWNMTVTNFKDIPSTAFGKVAEALDWAVSSWARL